MRALWAVALNEIKVEFSDRSAWLNFLALPLIFTLVIGLATSGFGGRPDADPRLLVGVVNLDSGAPAAQFVEALGQSETVRVTPLTESAARQRVEADELVAAVSVPAGFGAGLLAGRPVELTVHLKAASNYRLAVSEAVQAAAAQVSRPALAAGLSVAEAQARRPFANAAEQQAYFESGLQLAVAAADPLPVTVVTTQAMPKPEVEIPVGLALSSPGQLVTWVLATLLAGAATLVHERTTGTLRRLLTMPVPRWAILGGKIVGRLVMGLAQMAILIGFGQWVLGVNWGRSPVALGLVAVCYSLAATALGLLLATLVRTARQADSLVSLGVFLLAPLGGAWVPLEITPPAFQTLAQIFPTTWAMRGFTDVVARGQGPAGVSLECAVLLGFAVVFFAVGVRRFKYE